MLSMLNPAGQSGTKICWFFSNKFFLSALVGTVASYLTLRDTFTKPKSQQNNSSSTYNSQALERSYGKNLNVFTTCRHRQQLQRPPAWFTSHSQSRRMLLGHLANSWRRYLIGCQAGFINCFTSFYSCLNDLASLSVTWLLRRCPHRNEAVAAISGNCNICSEQETCNNIDGVTAWRAIVKSNIWQ